MASDEPATGPLPPFLQDARYLSLATYRRDGTPVATPVWAAGEAGRMYVFTAGDSGKVKRLRRSSRARLAPCTVRGVVLGDWHDARAHVVEGDPDTVARAYRALRRKYGLQMALTDLVSKLTGRYRRRAVLEIELLDASIAP